MGQSFDFTDRLMRTILRPCQIHWPIYLKLLSAITKLPLSCTLDSTGHQVLETPLSGLANFLATGMRNVMYRYALMIEYDGSAYNGWQRQKNQPTIQQSVEVALRKLEPEMRSIVAAGRTDSGVHAYGQVVHCDLEKPWMPWRLRDAVNANLRPEPIAIRKVASVNEDFDARFSAERRCYLYRIALRRAPLTLCAEQIWHVPMQLDCNAMRVAASHLVGRHDFTTFRSVHCQAKSPVKTLDRIEIDLLRSFHGQEIQLIFSARSFLHRQVRSIVGTLERVGAGAWNHGDVAAALNAKNRSRCGPVAPAHGLALKSVHYEPDPFSDA